MIIVGIILIWLLGGLISNILLRKQELSNLFRLLLLLEGLMGLLFILILRKQG